MRYLLLMLFILPLFALAQQAQTYKTTLIHIGAHQQIAEISNTMSLQEKGLQGHDPLCEHSSMLFPYQDEAIRTFWMKDMTFPIDIIWIDKNHQVVDISANAPVCKKDPCPLYQPEKPIQYVLEVKAGLAKKWGIKPGTHIDFDLKNT